MRRSRRLLHQRLTIDDHECRYLVVRNERTGDHGLACARWRDEDSQIVLSQSVEGRALFTSELGCKDKVRRLRIRASIRHNQTASSLGNDLCSLRRDPTWDQETVEGFAIAADEPGGIPGGKPQTFLLVVRRVVQRGRVFERREQSRGDSNALDAQHGAHAGRDLFWRLWRPRG